MAKHSSTFLSLRNIEEEHQAHLRHLIGAQQHRPTLNLCTHLAKASRRAVVLTRPIAVSSRAASRKAAAKISRLAAKNNRPKRPTTSPPELPALQVRATTHRHLLLLSDDCPCLMTAAPEHDSADRANTANAR